MPQFWLGAGLSDKADVSNAEYFAQELQLHLANVPLDLTAGGGHTMGTWHAEVPAMLAWMTKGLAAAVAKAERLARDKAAMIAHHSKHPTTRLQHPASAHPSPGHSPARQ